MEGNDSCLPVIEKVSYEGGMIFFYRVFKLEPGPDRISYTETYFNSGCFRGSELFPSGSTLFTWEISEMNKIF